jgi:hypothetical protein
MRAESSRTRPTEDGRTKPFCLRSLPDSPEALSVPGNQRQICLNGLQNGSVRLHAVNRVVRRQQCPDNGATHCPYHDAYCRAVSLASKESMGLPGRRAQPRSCAGAHSCPDEGIAQTRLVLISFTLRTSCF